jgi:hypothetical protein
MFKLRFCLEGEDRLSVLLAPDLDGPSSESDFTNASVLLDVGRDRRLQGIEKAKRVAERILLFQRVLYLFDMTQCRPGVELA